MTVNEGETPHGKTETWEHAWTSGSDDLGPEKNIHVLSAALRGEATAEFGDAREKETFPHPPTPEIRSRRDQK